MSYLPALAVFLLVMLAVMTVFLFHTQETHRSHLKSQLEDQSLMILRQEREIQRLTTILASKDPMTYQVLSQAPTISLNSEEDSPYLTEEEEARRFAILTGKVDADGNPDEDFSDDLRMLGL